MSGKLGPIDVCCDAPPYPVVRATRRFDFHTPEDVRWRRMSRFLHEREGWHGVFNTESWKALLGMGGRARSACSCGQELPILERYTFLFLSGGQASYLLGQCGRCHTIFWEDA
jgi:hypothetical protein